MIDLDFLIQLSLAPLGFFGLLGMLGGMGKKGGGAPSQAPSQTPQAPKAVQDAAPPAAVQEAPEQPQSMPNVQPDQPPPITQNLLDDVDVPVQQQKIEQANPLQNLLDDEGTKPGADPAPPKAGEPLEPPDFTNKTETDMPTATQKEDKLGTVPQTERTEILPNRIMDAGTNDQPFQYQEGMAARQVDTGDSENPTMGYQYKQGTTVAGGLPKSKYRNR